MGAAKKENRLLLVTPEITYLPEGMGNLANFLTAKAGGLADVSASLVAYLYEKDVDVHVALPNYRAMFNRKISQIHDREMSIYRSKLSDDRIHLAEDRCFYYRDQVYDSYASQNMKLALAFQREVINNIIPRVQPDIIHCNDWMTGLIPAVARRLNIPCLFTVHNIHTLRTNLETIEESGIDAATFWPFLYYDRLPSNYEETRANNRVDFLVSGIFGATAINTVSPTFLAEIVHRRHPFVSEPVVREFTQKLHKGMAIGVLNSPDPGFNPEIDEALVARFGPDNHREGKTKNKLALQKMLGLELNPNAPLFFWPSRLDPVQKGCGLLGEIFGDIVKGYARDGLQIVVVANGPYQAELHRLVTIHDLYRRVSICDFDENLSHLGYAAADFLFMPSSFEPCGLPQMIGPIYGTLPVAHDTGGIHDTVSGLSVERGTGNGFLFEVHDATGFKWAVDQAVRFHRLPEKIKSAQIARIMTESLATFNQDITADHYVKIYRTLLQKK